MSSIKPNNGCGQIDGAEEVLGRLVVTRGDGTILFEASEEVLDQVPRLVDVAVVGTLHLAGRVGGNHDLLARPQQRFDDPLARIVGTIGNERFGLRVHQQGVSALLVVDLARREMEPGGVAQRIDRGMDLGAQPAPAASDGLRRPPFAPARC